MTYFNLWERIGKQLIRDTRHQNVKVFTDNEEYIVKRIIYENGIIKGLYAIPKIN